MKSTWLIGIDEVGRGPLAGPVTLCACAIPMSTRRKLFAGQFKGVKDSKKLSAVSREFFFAKAKIEYQKGTINYSLSHVSAGVIDKVGISRAVSRAIERCLNKLEAPAHSKILLDGSLKAPKQFIHQKTIIRGDATEPIISLASIIAKVTRDKKMTKLAQKFPGYGFEIHKGYGTKIHQKAIRKNGLSPLHRATFCH